MKATEIGLLASVSRPTLDSLTARAVFAVSRPHLGADATIGQLWSVPLDGSTPPRRITRGFHDTDPRFSPDGARIAFLRGSAGQPSQLYVVDAAGGEPVQITDAPLGVSGHRWAPDSARVAYLARVPEQGRYGTVEGRDASAESPRHITTLRYKSNGLGYTNDRRAQVFVVEVPALDAEPVYDNAPDENGPGASVTRIPAPRQLTFGNFDHGPLSWAPDSSSLLVVAARHETGDTDLRGALYWVPVTTVSEPRPITGGNLAVEYGIFDPSGGVYFLAQDLGESGRDFVAAHTGLYRIDQPGHAARRLTDPATVDLGESGSDISLLADGSALVQVRTRGTVQLARVTQDATIAPLTSGAIEVTGQTTGAAGIVVAVTTSTSAGEIAVVEQTGLRYLTDFGSDIRSAGIRQPRELVATARDGAPVHGWVLLPEGEGPHPVLLSIHGGPFSQYVSTLFDEVQVYADAGYAVVFCNPRGSAGYGFEHGRAIRQAMGTVDHTDVMDFLDAALASDPSLDPSRVGIMGGSYGGYLTAWIIAHETRFTAAIVERGFLDPDAFVGTSDIGSFFGQEYVGTDAHATLAQSPQAAASRVTIPTFVVHSADDLRCPLGQAERYYATLKAQGVDSELLIFPGENHELSRSGRPRHRVQRFDAILEWWARHLPVNAPAVVPAVVPATPAPAPSESGSGSGSGAHS